MSGGYRFEFASDGTDFRVENAEQTGSDVRFDVESVYPEISVVVTVNEEEADLASLLAAFRRLVIASGFSESQAKQIVLIPHDEVQE